MSDKLFDALDNLSEDDDSEESDASAQDVNDALGEDERYWKSRNQAKKVQDALSSDDEDEE